MVKTMRPALFRYNASKPPARYGSQCANGWRILDTRPTRDTGGLRRRSFGPRHPRDGHLSPIAAALRIMGIRRCSESERRLPGTTR
ncbi:hypothetical protein SJ05684_c19640 [Sinorhizobium sojae CCBAU 05684]|uniref:Uncharacterized protein n=1 Tax=Sinorhizobium sojae CCBAU 05684 TaxID=716928 RepID=A0A249PC48_9HYPH|nr:hypothetical protein SJ05684_c19640 [Sinorhizobium sojae CCBAU 05684]